MIIIEDRICDRMIKIDEKSYYKKMWECEIKDFTPPFPIWRDCLR